MATIALQLPKLKHTFGWLVCACHVTVFFSYEEAQKQLQKMVDEASARFSFPFGELALRSLWALLCVTTAYLDDWVSPPLRNYYLFG
jgi:fatty acid desaturase